jgi:hypothetical protein
VSNGAAGRRVRRLEQQADDDNADWSHIYFLALLGDATAKAKVDAARKVNSRALRAAIDRFWVPFAPGGSHYKPELWAELCGKSAETDEQGMGCA